MRGSRWCSQSKLLQGVDCLQTTRSTNLNSVDDDEVVFVTGRRHCGFSNDHRHLIHLAQTLQARRNVHWISDNRIIEALLRSHVADNAVARVDSDADGDPEIGARQA